MSKITVVAKIVAKQVAVEAVKTELLKLILPTRKESGCIEYLLHQDNQDPALFFFYETWESAASLEQHKIPTITKLTSGRLTEWSRTKSFIK